MELQFGHGGDAVENGQLPNRSHTAEALQFGHGGDAVENKNPMRTTMNRWRSFNSATAVMPWKTPPSSPMSPSGLPPLQFGHGGDAVENGFVGPKMGHGYSGFNSATAVMPWKTRIVLMRAPPFRGFNSATAVMPWKTRKRQAPSRRPRGFNSATAVMPWKTAYTRMEPGGAVVLQFGHGGDAVENADAVLMRHGIAALQFGHGGDAVENRPERGRVDREQHASIRPRR